MLISNVRQLNSVNQQSKTQLPWLLDISFNYIRPKWQLKKRTINNYSLNMKHKNINLSEKLNLNCKTGNCLFLKFYHLKDKWKGIFIGTY
jgi:hypothetical protein